MNTRNTQCSCGSGKKTKKCCGNEAEKARRYQEAWKPRIIESPSQDDSDHAAPRRVVRRRSNYGFLALASALAWVPRNERF